MRTSYQEAPLWATNESDDERVFFQSCVTKTNRQHATLALMISGSPEHAHPDELVSLNMHTQMKWFPNSSSANE